MTYPRMRPGIVDPYAGEQHRRSASQSAIEHSACPRRASRALPDTHRIRRRLLAGTKRPVGNLHGADARRCIRQSSMASLGFLNCSAGVLLGRCTNILDSAWHQPIPRLVLSFYLLIRRGTLRYIDSGRLTCARCLIGRLGIDTETMCRLEQGGIIGMSFGHEV